MASSNNIQKHLTEQGTSILQELKELQFGDLDISMQTKNLIETVGVSGVEESNLFLNLLESLHSLPEIEDSKEEVISEQTENQVQKTETTSRKIFSEQTELENETNQKHFPKTEIAPKKENTASSNQPKERNNITWSTNNQGERKFNSPIDRSTKPNKAPNSFNAEMETEPQPDDPTQNSVSFSQQTSTKAHEPFENVHSEEKETEDQSVSNKFNKKLEQEAFVSDNRIEDNPEIRSSKDTNRIFDFNNLGEVFSNTENNNTKRIGGFNALANAFSSEELIQKIPEKETKEEFENINTSGEIEKTAFSTEEQHDRLIRKSTEKIQLESDVEENVSKRIENSTESKNKTVLSKNASSSNKSFTSVLQEVIENTEQTEILELLKLIQQEVEKEKQTESIASANSSETNEQKQVTEAPSSSTTTILEKNTIYRNTNTDINDIVESEEEIVNEPELPFIQPSSKKAVKNEDYKKWKALKADYRRFYGE